MTTRGGTNQFHGILNWLHRNDALHGGADQHSAARGTFDAAEVHREPLRCNPRAARSARIRRFSLSTSTIRRSGAISVWKPTPAQFTPTAQGLRTLVEAFPEFQHGCRSPALRTAHPPGRESAVSPGISPLDPGALAIGHTGIRSRWDAWCVTSRRRSTRSMRARAPTSK